jgi:arylsulfatase A-like enzyme
MLKDKGYSTGIFGKWHLGDNYPFRPGDQGFDESLIHLTGGMAQPGDITTYLRGDSAYFDPVLWHNGKQAKYKGYCSDIFASEAIRFIERNAGKPFFCYLAFNAPHTPLQVPGKYYDMYRNTDPSSGFTGSSIPEMTEKDKEDARRVYAMVTNIDDNVGKLLQKVDEAGIARNTVIIFMTDNGPQQRRYVAGMRGLKSSVFRGGVRVPFFIRYPAGKILDRDISVTSAHIDVLPTIAEFCGTRLPTDRMIDGRSMVPYLKGMPSKSNERALFFYWTRRNPEKYNNIALMKGKYRLVGQTDHNAGPSDFQLYDIDSDPGEKVNIVTQNKNIATAMKSSLDSILAELSASKNMVEPPYISIGTKFENPVFLNRNDAWGEREVWEQEEVYGVWRIDVTRGHYTIRYRFKNTVPPKGRMVADLKSLSLQQKNNENGINVIEMKDVELPGGRCEFYPYYEVAGKRILPLWVEIERNE